MHETVRPQPPTPSVDGGNGPSPPAWPVHKCHPAGDGTRFRFPAESPKPAAVALTTSSSPPIGLRTWASRRQTHNPVGNKPALRVGGSTARLGWRWGLPGYGARLFLPPIITTEEKQKPMAVEPDEAFNTECDGKRSSF